MARVTQKTVERAQAKAQFEKQKKAVADLRGKLISTADPVKRAEIEADMAEARFKQQEAGRKWRGPKRRKD